MIMFLANPMAANAASRSYGVTAWYSSPQSIGADVAKMLVVSGNVTDYASGGFTAQVLWQGTNNDGGLNTWIEEGYTYGWDKHNILTWYWAQNRPNGGGYSETQITDQTPHVGQNNDVEIVWALPNWDIDLNGVFEYSVQGMVNPCCGKAMETGAELTSTSSQLSDAHSYGLAYHDPVIGWVAEWTGANNWVTGGGYAYWNLTHVNLIDGQP
jgi:hypothetical protein